MVYHVWSPDADDTNYFTKNLKEAETYFECQKKIFPGIGWRIAQEDDNEEETYLDAYEPNEDDESEA
jgi:hypothetical protein